FGIETDLTYDAKGALATRKNAHAPDLTILRTTLADGAQQIVTTMSGRTFTANTDLYGRLTFATGPFGSTRPSYDTYTGLNNSVTTTFRSLAETTAWTLTNTG